MRAMIAFSLVCVSACTTSGQNSPPSQSPSDVEPVAVVSIHVDTHSFKSGEDIEITILLEAGRGGVYIPKEWGHFGGGIPGFSISLTTLSGRPAETCGGAADRGSRVHELSAKAVLDRDFIYLPAQHIVGLKTSIGCPTKQRGKYLINASYSPYLVDAESVAQLPETHGLVLKRVVQAKPVTISIY
jgi:hypothetical protein